MIENNTHVTEKQRLRNAQFLYEELPIRLAKKAQELESLPYGMSLSKPVSTVRSWYVDSFREMVVSQPPSKADDLEPFTNMLEQILSRHSNVVPMMARGVLQAKNMYADSLVGCPFLQDFLDRFYLSRIGLRVLIAQQVAMADPIPGYAGTINLNLNPVEVAEIAIENATLACERTYGIAPEVDIIGANGNDPTMSIGFIPSHLHHMLFEILKNSFRAVVERHGIDSVPNVTIIFCEGAQDWTIRVSDQGGGLRRDHTDKVWSYLHSTALQPPDNFLEEASHSNGANLSHAPMAGLGYGLPLSRLFARYFGGDLQMMSMDGYGTDVYLYLNKLTCHNLDLG